jgi:photosystem II stability/assembly factor-like uncharacterized protein
MPAHSLRPVRSHDAQSDAFPAANGALAFRHRWPRLIVFVALLASILLFTLGGTAFAAAKWRSVKAGVTIHQLDAVSFADAQHGWMFGLDTAIVTVDGGAHWTKLTLPDTLTFTNDAVFVDSLHGWVAGAHYGNRYGTTGCLIATSDGGQTWTTQVSNISGALLGVDFVDELHGWAIGAKGLILATADGGMTWTRQASGVSQAVRAIDFVNTLDGWAVYYTTSPRRAYLLQTRNGGAKWTRRSLGYATLVGDLFRFGSRRGWISLFNPIKKTLVTTDAGAHWRGRPMPAAVGTFETLEFSSARSGFASPGTVFGGTALYRTTNGGASWSAAWTLPRGTRIGGINDVAIIDATHAWAVGFRELKQGNGLILRYAP